MSGKTDDNAAAAALLASDIGVGSSVLDSRVRLLYVNPTVEALLGQSSAAVVGKPLAEVRSSERQSAVAEIIDQVRPPDWLSAGTGGPG